MKISLKTVFGVSLLFCLFLGWLRLDRAGKWSNEKGDGGYFVKPAFGMNDIQFNRFKNSNGTYYYIIAVNGGLSN